MAPSNRKVVRDSNSLAISQLPLTFAEYFAGIGLVRMGLESNGWQVLFANDFSDKKFEMYKAFFPDADKHYIIKDVFDVDLADVPQTTLATCSFPCIDLSLAGNMSGLHGKHSSAFWGFIKVLTAQGASAPPFVLVENVPGWLYSNHGADFRLTIKTLNQLGYACDVFELDARRFTPQSRPRIFLIGTRLGTAGDHLKDILKRPPSLASARLKKSLSANQDLQWFYTDLPAPPSLNAKGLTRIIEKMSDADERWWAEMEVQRHLKMMAPTHAQRVNELVNQPQDSYRTFFRRRRQGEQRAEVRDDDLAGCLRTAVGGSGKQFLIKAGHGHIKMRPMTPREYARLQGVPDKYAIVATGVQALTGFGDAVCVPVISWIAQYALTPLAQSQFVMQAPALSHV